MVMAPLFSWERSTTLGQPDRQPSASSARQPSASGRQPTASAASACRRCSWPEPHVAVPHVTWPLPRWLGGRLGTAGSSWPSAWASTPSAYCRWWATLTEPSAQPARP